MVLLCIQNNGLPLPLLQDGKVNENGIVSFIFQPVFSNKNVEAKKFCNVLQHGMQEVNSFRVNL